MILVVTRAIDTTADHVLNRMKERNVPHIRLNTDTIGKETEFELSFGHREKQALQVNNQTIPVESITGVWFRRFAKPEMPHIRNEEARRFAEQELEFTTRWFLDALSCRIVDPECNILRARNKFLQLQLAQHLGFAIPPTLISNNPETAKKFILEQPSAIAKSIARFGAQRQNGFVAIYTTSVTPRELSRIETVRVAPVCFQKNIQKTFELRITVVGEKVFGCRIDSQKSARTRVDWRRYDFDNTPHSAYQVDRSLAEKLVSMMSYFEIKFAAFDLIVTPEDELIFLEMNPSAQFVWIEELTNLPITDTLIDELTTIR